MKQKYVLLNGINFKVLNDTKSGKMLMKHIDEQCHGYGSIFEAYGKPSERKVAIWESWLEWFHNTFESGQMVVSSKNCNFFSITFKGYTENAIYRGYITVTRNEVVFCER